MDYPHPKSKFKPISVALNKPSRSVGAKRGFHDQSILRHWNEYVGDEIAQLCKPREIKSMRGRGAILILDCVSSHASELMMRTEEIRAKLNSKIGHNAIAKIQLHHQHVGFEKKQTPTKPMIKSEKKLPTDLEQDLEQTQNDELRAALLTFSRSFYNKGDS